MDDIIKVIRIACYNLKKTFTSSKIYIIIILSFMYIQFMLNPVKVFAENVQIGVSSYLFPFLLTSSYSVKIFLLLVILLFCNAPFMDEAQLYILVRTGRRKWCAGQMLYIMILSGFYTVLLILFTVITLIPELSIEIGWGKVINTLAQTGIAASQGIPISFDYSIILKYHPITAMILEGFLCWLLFILFGNIIFTVNMKISKFAGNIIAVALVFFQMIAEEISPLLTYFSPASWVSLSFLDINNINQYPGVNYALTVMVILNLVLITVSIIGIKTKTFVK